MEHKGLQFLPYCQSCHVMSTLLTTAICYNVTSFSFIRKAGLFCSCYQYFNNFTFKISEIWILLIHGQACFERDLWSICGQKKSHMANYLGRALKLNKHKEMNRMDELKTDNLIHSKMVAQHSTLSLQGHFVIYFNNNTANSKNKSKEEK